MNDREKIRRALNGINLHVGALQGELARLEEQRDRLETALGVLEEFSTQEREDTDIGLASPNLTLKAAIGLVLEAAGGPLAAKDIVSRLEASEYQYDKDSETLFKSVRSILSRGNKHRDLVFRIKRGVYGVIGRDEPRGDAVPADADARTALGMQGRRIEVGER